ncbi:hypothetical protein BFX40_23640 [Mesorhizobium sp. SEMIA 3007]|uniref:hypothetical protein n=1 Tax=Mesorhizobium sp. SEMIA 3007 TaxID=1862350 RepID=UPI00083E151D|nr:hypothetical protein [Mesorhizobium sp. SEMIA 3007]ODA95556.1 hypothetical protein BFX40_23640 [Mesorhizobium sp. SEMIA 3007]
MSSIYSWSTTAATNSTSDTLINWAEGQAPSTVNGSAREMMARVAEFIDDIGGAIAAGGTANALTVTANSPFAAYADGLMLAVRIATDNTGAATLNVNGLGVKSIRKMVAAGEVVLASGDLQAAGISEFRYSTALNSGAGAWLLLNPINSSSLSNPTSAGTILDVNTAGQAIGVNGTPAVGSNGLRITTISPATTAASFMTFDRNGTFAANFGIDTDNDLKIGGFSMGANAYKVMHENLTTGTFAGTYTFSGAATFGSSITAASNITTAGSFTANTSFLSSSINAVVANNGGTGAVYLRPNGAGSTTGQVQISSSGAVAINGAATVSGTLTVGGVQVQTDTGAANAALAVGAVGTYAQLVAPSAGNIGAGATLAGSSLRYANAAGDDTGVSPSGTWKLMGISLGPSGSAAQRTSLWLRIS